MLRGRRGAGELVEPGGGVPVGAPARPVDGGAAPAVRSAPPSLLTLQPRPGCRRSPARDGAARDGAAPGGARHAVGLARSAAPRPRAGHRPGHGQRHRPRGAITRGDLELAAQGREAAVAPSAAAASYPARNACATAGLALRAGGSRASAARTCAAYRGPAHRAPCAPTTCCVPHDACASPTPPRHPTSTTPCPDRTSGGAACRTDSMRQSVAALMTTSNREIPHYYLDRDGGPPHRPRVAAEAQPRAAVEERLVPSALLLLAAAAAARAVPDLNGHWVDGALPARRRSSTSGSSSRCAAAASSCPPSTTPTASRWAR